MTWVDWLKVAALAFGAVVAVLAALVCALCAGFKQLGEGPERIVDVDNRGQTRIRMPDGSIK